MPATKPKTMCKFRARKRVMQLLRISHLRFFAASAQCVDACNSENVLSAATSPESDRPCVPGAANASSVSEIARSSMCSESVSSVTPSVAEITTPSTSSASRPSNGKLQRALRQNRLGVCSSALQLCNEIVQGVCLLGYQPVVPDLQIFLYIVLFPCHSTDSRIKSVGMQMAWQGLPGQPQVAAAQTPMAQGLQQPGMIGAYPMQQYQAQ
ncbi:hypothetical protein HPB51_023594 [Rhipicephalus microplus]|uniref:Uncharacterized protein n=1 Tax=Rhipicephalus microplus TaxID=6941 RepID=A0A9J6DD03_RHIMP|nr:hypothetical protein HPB51_023594 [Rhipicephalus microplus]